MSHEVLHHAQSTSYDRGYRYGLPPPPERCPPVPPAPPPLRRLRRRDWLTRLSSDAAFACPPFRLPASDAAGRLAPLACPAALAAFLACFSLARLRSSALRARISAMRSAIGTSNRCFGLLA